MPLGIIAATIAEARILYRGAIAPAEWIRLPEGGMLLRSGIGPLRARQAARALMEKGATALVSWGTAGGLLPGLSPGSLILPERILGLDQSAYPVDPIWHERLCRRLKGDLDLHHEAIAESTGVLASCPEKAALWRRTGAIATDMESASIAGVAKERRVPFMAIRAILDPAEMPITPSVLDSIDDFGRIRLSKLGQGLIRNPMGLLALFRLIRNFRAAQNSLSKTHLRAGSQFLCPSEPPVTTPVRKAGRTSPHPSERMDS